MAKRVYKVIQGDRDVMVEANSASEAVMIAMNGTVSAKVIETSELLTRLRSNEQVYTADDVKAAAANAAPEPAPAANQDGVTQPGLAAAAGFNQGGTNGAPPAGFAVNTNGGASAQPPANWMGGNPGAGQAAE